MNIKCERKKKKDKSQQNKTHNLHNLIFFLYDSTIYKFISNIIREILLLISFANEWKNSVF